MAFTVGSDPEVSSVGGHLRGLSIEGKKELTLSRKPFVLNEFTSPSLVDGEKQETHRVVGGISSAYLPYLDGLEAIVQTFAHNLRRLYNVNEKAARAVCYIHCTTCLLCQLISQLQWPRTTL